MRHALLTACLFLATLLCSNASAQTTWVGTATLENSNVPGLSGDFSCTLIEVGDTRFLFIDGVNFSECLIDLEYSPPFLGPVAMMVECPPYWGRFSLSLQQVFLGQ